MEWIVIRIYAFLTNGKLVCLEDYQKDVYITIARKSPFGGYKAYVYWFTRTGSLHLHDDGSVTGRSYIKRWKFLTPKE